MFDYLRVALLFPANQLNDDHLWRVSNAKVHTFAQHDRFHSPSIDVATSVQDVGHFCARFAFYAAIMHGSGDGLAEAETSGWPNPGALGGGPRYRGWRVICAHKSGSSVHTDPVHLYTQSCLGMGWGGVGWAKNVHVPVHTQTQQTLSSFFSPADTGTFLGMGWGGVITFMFLCTHRHSNLIIFLAVLQTQALLLADQLPVGWGGVMAHVPVHTHRHTKPLGWSVTAKMGWGGVITFMFLFTHRHTQPVHLSCWHYSFMISYRWGGVGWGRVKRSWAGPDEDEKENEMRWDEKDQMRLRCGEMRSGWNAMRWDEMRWDEKGKRRRSEMPWDVSMPCSRPTTVSYRHLSFEHLQPYRFLSWNLTPPPTSWFAACKWWMMPVISCRLWII